MSTLDPRSRRAAGEGDYAGLGLIHSELVFDVLALGFTVTLKVMVMI